MKTIVSAVFSVIVFVSFGKTCTWTGGAETTAWTDAGNWDQMPASDGNDSGDTVVFKPQGSLTVDCPATGWPNVRPATMRFESGTVTLNTGSQEFTMQSNENEIYVARNAKAIIVLNSNFRIWIEGYTFRKTGEGELVFKCPDGNVTRHFDYVSDYWKSRELVSVDEGTMTFDANGGQFNFYSTNVVVNAGAKLLFKGKYALHGNAKFTGGGDMWDASSDDEVVDGSKILLTGWLGAAENAVLRLAGFDLSKDTGLLSGIVAEPGATVRFYGSSFADIGLPVRGSGAIVDVNAHGAKFSDIALDGGGEMVLRGKSEIAGKDVSVAEINAAGGRTTVMTISGGKIYNGSSIGSAETDTDIASPNGIKTTGAIGTASFELTGGDYWWLSGNSTADIFLRGGVFHPMSGAVRNMTQGLLESDPSPRQVVFDGGTAELYAKAGSPFLFFKYNENYDNAETTVMYVTDKGGRIIARKPNGRTEDFTFITTNAFLTCTNTTVSGPLVFSGWGDFVFGAPMELNGPVEFRDGTAVVTASQLAGGAAPFGSGDLRLRNARVFCDERSGEGHKIASVPLVSGSGSAIVYEGACEIAARNENTAVAKTVTASAIRRAGPGAALYLRDGKSTSKIMYRIGEDGFSAVKLDKPPTVDAGTGLLREPVFIGAYGGEYLATYNAEKGFVPHDTVYTHATDFTGGATKVLAPGNSATPLTLGAGEEAHVAAVRCGNFAKIVLDEGSRLKVGNGTDPAMVLLSVCGKIYGMTGTLDFGTSEAVIGCNNCTDVATPGGISAVIAGSGGVTIVSDPDGVRDRRLDLLGNNVYTGGTRISAVRVEAGNKNCFSSGDVHVLGGEATGGAVVFDKEAVWENDFHIAGHGYRDDSVNSSRGCVEFKANAGISGDVELVEEASVNVSAGFTGTISGTVSGDRLKLYNSQGILNLSGENTYTGGTEVARSTLAVSAASGLGTGEVLLDGGNIEFCNAAAMTVANNWRGIGTVRLGSSEVRFTGKIDKRSNIALDCPYDVTFTEIPPFGCLVNSSSRASTLTLAVGDHVLDVDAVEEGVFNLVLEDGARLDLGGGTLVVRRFTGERARVSGTIVETNPKKGGYMVIR